MGEETIFNDALEKTDQRERAAYLDEVCGRDEVLRRRIESLLALHAEAGDFLERPPIEPAASDATAAFHERPALWDGLTDISLDFLSPSAKPDCLGRLGQYEIKEIIGRGAMGAVFKAHDLNLNRTVAVKVLAPERAANPMARKRFLREARAAAAVVHPHVVTIHAVGDEENMPYLVMECVDGASLGDKIAKEGTLNVKEILRIGSQIADGLAAAHNQGLIHRDIKPANILLENGVERVKITDFGLARAVDDVSVTQTGEVAGTPPFMSPEQAEGTRLDQRTDLFSLGSVLYTMCTGWAPFRADSTIATLRRVCDGTPRPIHELNPDIPEWLIVIIDRLLQKNPECRFQTAHEVADLLRQHLAELQHPTSVPKYGPVPELGPDPRGTTPSGRAKTVPWNIAAGVLLILAIGVGISEATGITNVRTTVIRWLTPKGTLVVEVDDPAVSVAIDGEDMVITGAGVNEIRLKPGRHTFRATRDGKVVCNELVTVAVRGRQVVRVRREGDLGPAAAAWAKSVAALPVEKQEQAVTARLKALNPGFDGTVEITSASALIPRLSIHGDGLQDVSPLRALSNIHSIVSRNKNFALADLSPMQGMKLTEVVLHYSAVSDLMPLRGMKLVHLDCTASQNLADLSPLQGMPLRMLSIPNTKVNDLSPLKGMKLDYLNCEGTAVSDLSPLEGMPLSTLDITNTDVSNISPLKGLPLKEIRLDFRPERDAAVLRTLTTLEAINGQPTAAFWKVLDNE